MFIKLTEDLQEHEPIFVNPDKIFALKERKDREGSYTLVYSTERIVFDVTETPEEIIKLIEGEPENIITDSPILDQTISDAMELCVRTSRCLEDAGLKTVRDVVTTPLLKLRGIRNMGIRSIRELSKELERLGLTLDMKGK
jgi:DNA-directed RNA polymerase alpha subunit